MQFNNQLFLIKINTKQYVSAPYHITEWTFDWCEINAMTWPASSAENSAILQDFRYGFMLYWPIVFSNYHTSM